MSYSHNFQIGPDATLTVKVDGEIVYSDTEGGSHEVRMDGHSEG